MKITVSQCTECGFVFNSPRATESFLADYYSNSLMASGQIYRDTSQTGYYPQLNLERAEYFSAFLQHRPNGKFLDIGCGQGGFIKAMQTFLPDNWVSYGLDPSHEAVRIANENGHNVTCGLLGNDHFEKQSFDAISLVSVLEHLPRPKHAIEAIKDLLKPDGIVFIEVPNTLHPEFSLTGHFSLEHICHFSPGLLHQLFVEQNWHDTINDPRISDHGLRLVGSNNLSNWGVSKPDVIPLDRDKLRTAVLTYAEKEQELIKMLKRRILSVVEKWRSDNTNFAIYGAGDHTFQLMSYVDILSGSRAIIDGDKRKQGTRFLERPVIGPEDLTSQNIKGVLISSQRFQNEIEQKLQDLYGTSIEIATCYDDPENLFTS